MLRFAIRCGIALFCCLAAGLPTATAQGTKRPNVLLIIADDLRNDLGCYGHPFVKSPNLDRLAARGMRFDRAYCQYPVCNPSRTSLLTGLRPDSTRILNNMTRFRSTLPDAVTLPQLFRQAGYFTASLGKIFHRGQTIEDVKGEMDDPKSWDLRKYFVATARGKEGEGRNMTDGKLAWCRWVAAEGGDEDQPDGQIAVEAVRLLEQKRSGPFFLAVGFHRPHDPFIAPKRYYEPYPLAKMQPPADTGPLPGDPKLAIPGGAKQFPFTDREKREFQRAYYAGVTFMDAQVGKVLDALDRLKLWDNTIVIFIGDHGYHLGERGWWNKSTLFELSARAPLLVWAPPMKAPGKSCARLVEFVDIYQTVTDLCGLKAPAGLEGLSFRPLLDDPARVWKTAAFTQVQRGKIAGRTIRTERWRYTEWDNGKAGVELYDHQNDPQERRNLATVAGNAETVAGLTRQLQAGWRGALPKRTDQ
ncbi:MAG TPA: sulfatase [Gemmataceae bacterium]|nr:sulfatase [Gemmataceae bacterium]